MVQGEAYDYKWLCKHAERDIFDKHLHRAELRKQNVLTKFLNKTRKK